MIHIYLRINLWFIPFYNYSRCFPIASVLHCSNPKSRSKAFENELQRTVSCIGFAWISLWFEVFHRYFLRRVWSLHHGIASGVAVFGLWSTLLQEPPSSILRSFEFKLVQFWKAMASMRQNATTGNITPHKFLIVPSTVAFSEDVLCQVMTAWWRHRTEKGNLWSRRLVAWRNLTWVFLIFTQRRMFNDRCNCWDRRDQWLDRANGLALLQLLHVAMPGLGLLRLWNPPWSQEFRGKAKEWLRWANELNARNPLVEVQSRVNALELDSHMQANAAALPKAGLPSGWPQCKVMQSYSSP